MDKQPPFISAAEMRKVLRAAYDQDPESSLLAALLRRLRDPAMPFDSSGRARAHPLWLAILLILLSACTAFVIFTALER